MVVAREDVMEDDLEDTVDVFFPANTGEDTLLRGCEPYRIPLGFREQRESRWINGHILASSISGSGKPFADIVAMIRLEAGS